MKSDKDTKCCEKCWVTEISTGNHDGTEYAPVSEPFCSNPYCPCHQSFSERESYKLAAKPIGNVWFNGIEYTPVVKADEPQESWQPTTLKDTKVLDSIPTEDFTPGGITREVYEESWEVEKLAEQLHVWYLEACKSKDAKFNIEAQKPYAELPEGSKFLDRYIAKQVLAQLLKARRDGSEETKKIISKMVDEYFEKYKAAVKNEHFQAGSLSAVKTMRKYWFHAGKWHNAGCPFLMSDAGVCNCKIKHPLSDMKKRV